MWFARHVKHNVKQKTKNIHERNKMINGFMQLKNWYAVKYNVFSWSSLRKLQLFRWNACEMISLCKHHVEMFQRYQEHDEEPFCLLTYAFSSFKFRRKIKRTVAQTNHLFSLLFFFCFHFTLFTYNLFAVGRKFVQTLDG